MDLVEGWPADLTDGKIHDRPPFDKPPHAREVPFAMIDGLIALANVDYRAVGLEDFGRPDNFLERQVDRWEGQRRSYQQRTEERRVRQESVSTRRSRWAPC